MPNSNTITVELLEATIYIEPNSNTCNAIRGTASINLSKQTKIKNLSVQFHGKMIIKGFNFYAKDMSGFFAQKKVLSRQHLILYPPHDQDNTDEPLILEAGLAQFGFEMQLPSGLTESIVSSDIKIRNYVTAVMEFYPDYVLGRYSQKTKEQKGEQILHIARVPPQDAVIGIQDLIHSGIKKSNWMCYHILVNKKSVALGSELPITFRFLPTHEEVVVDAVSVQVLERRNICRGFIHTAHYICGISPSSKSDVVFPSGVLKEDWEGTIDYIVPNNKGIVHSTQEYSDFGVNHTLLISMHLSIPNPGLLRSGRIRKILRFNVGIDILHEVAGLYEIAKLPNYCMTPPFDDSPFVYGEYDRKFDRPPTYCEI